MIFSSVVDVSPEQAVTVSCALPNENEVAVILKSAAGKELGAFVNPLPLPTVVPPTQPTYVNKPDNQLTIQELYLKAQKFDRALDRNMARKYYRMVLDQDALHLDALRDLAILDFESARYEEAAKGFVKALNQIPNDDGLAWYFLGMSNLRQGKADDAIKCGYKASRCLGTESIGFDLVGRGEMLQKKFKDAIGHFEQAIAGNRNNSAAFHHYCIALFANGSGSKALELVKSRVAINPTDLISRSLEAVVLKNPEKLTTPARQYLGEYDFEMLEASIAFSELGLAAEAAWILENACISGVPAEKRNILIQYHLAYLFAQSGTPDKSGSYLKQAAANNQDFIMASRPETLPVLEFAIRVNPNDALAHYQLGNLLGNYGRLDEASVQWTRAAEIRPTMSIPWRNLGLYHWVVKEDHAQSEECFRKAIQSRPLDQTLYRDFARVLVDNNKRPEAIKVLETMQFKGMRRSDIIQDLAQNYLDEKRFEEAYSLLIKTPYFVNWEGSTLTWDLFNKAHIGKGIDLFNQKKYKDALKQFEAALTFPENLGVGQSVRTEEAVGWYWKGKALKATGKNSEAAEAWRKGSVTADGSAHQNEYKKLCKMSLE